MKTEKQNFIGYLRKQGFSGNSLFNSLSLIPHYLVSPNKNHHLISTIRCCLFDGANTKKGDLGCVVFYYGGSYRPKYARNFQQQAEMQKKAFCPKNSKAAIAAFNIWRIETSLQQKTWKVII